MIEAAGLWSPFLTAYGGLVTTGGLVSGDLVILSAASSSVGLAAIQIAIQRGAIPVATTRLPHKKQRLLDAGAHEVYVSPVAGPVARPAGFHAGERKSGGWGKKGSGRAGLGGSGERTKK